METLSVDLTNYCMQFGYVHSSPFLAFYGDKGQDLFGNFWEAPYKMTVEKCTASSVETLFHASKYPSLSFSFNNKRADVAFKLSKSYDSTQKYKLRPNWHQVKFGIMKELLLRKFLYPEYKAALLATNDKYLVEHNIIIGRDDIWSDNCDGSGSNILGKLLMELRGEFGGVGIVPAPKEYIDWIKTQKYCEHCKKRLAANGFNLCRKGCVKK
jgi:N-glycosidase YbiA